jgi:hypothetical protein
LGASWKKNRKDNQKLFNRVLENFRKERKHPLKYVKGKDGKLLTNIEIMNRWREYILVLLFGTQEGMDLIAEEQVNTLQVEGEKGEENDIKEELEMAIKKLKVGKAAGCDKTAPEMVKYIGRTGRSGHGRRGSPSNRARVQLADTQLTQNHLLSKVKQPLHLTVEEVQLSEVKNWKNAVT